MKRFLLKYFIYLRKTRHDQAKNIKLGRQIKTLFEKKFINTDTLLKVFILVICYTVLHLDPYTVLIM